MTIGAALDREANGFTLVRLLLALAVVVSHGFSVASGRVEDEPLAAWTGFTLGEHAVNGFFVVSGFLVTMSYTRRGWRDYAVARTLRIAPGLVAATLVVAFGLGPALSRLPSSSYFADPVTWRFVAGTLSTFKSNAVLPEVFVGNPFRMPMGTVWTLKYEVLCYAWVLAAGLLGLLRGRLPAIVTTGGLLVAILALGVMDPSAPQGVRTALRLPFLFAAGGTLYLWRDRVPVSGTLAAALGGLALLMLRTPAWPALLFVAEAYGIVWLALGPLARAGPDLRTDLSYGVYLYGWPIQQALRQLFPDVGIGLLGPSLVLALCIAGLSWFCVEKPALALKARAIGLMPGLIEPAKP